MRLGRACPLNPRQRGFLASSGGCADNLMILNGIIKNARESGAPLAVVFVDFAKAFDSISHEHILCALKQRQVDQHVIGLIRNSYVDCVTRVGSCGERTSPISMKVGVKQGDPMSPLLFNLAMDPLIQALEDTRSGLGWEGRSITTLAFADDLVLVSGSVRGMKRNLEMLESICQEVSRVLPRQGRGKRLSILGVRWNASTPNRSGGDGTLLGCRGGPEARHRGSSYGPATPGVDSEDQTGSSQALTAGESLELICPPEADLPG